MADADSSSAVEDVIDEDEDRSPIAANQNTGDAMCVESNAAPALPAPEALPAPPALLMIHAPPVDRDEPMLPAIRWKRPRGDPDFGALDADLDDAEASLVDEAAPKPCAGGIAADCSSRSTVNVLLHLRMKSVERMDEVHVGGATYTRTSRSVERDVEMEVSSPPPQAAVRPHHRSPAPRPAPALLLVQAQVPT